MAKKKVIKTVTTTETVHKKSRAKKSTPKLIHPSDKNLEKVLVENFISLQKVMTDLSLKLDKLTNNISELLEIFEKSAEALAKKDFRTDGNERVLEGIKNLSEQNKIIAKGLTLMHEKTGNVPDTYIAPQINRMQPSPFQEQQKLEEPNIKRSSQEIDEYQGSIPQNLKRLRQFPKE